MSQPASTGRAPGKVILFGEHAVVYGYPAIAVPVSQVQALAQAEGGPPGQGTVVHAPDLGRRVVVREAARDDPLATIVRLALEAIRAAPDPDLTVAVRSTVPVARGMGSGASVSTAIVRALAAYYHRWLTSQAISDLVYQTEVLYHGTPSGIDNTVVAFEKPVFFVRGETREVFWVGRPFLLAIADTGIESPTREVVGDLRRRYEAEPLRYRPLFEEAGSIARQARAAIARGSVDELGGLMDRNHALLWQMDVSCPELDRLAAAAHEAGALGAKLSGAGRGGNMIALVTEESCGQVELMLQLAGAVRVLITEVS
ncbi:MAG TPA: mevalonate kinase [Anaerolineae bacterium]|nr:mevalonate kinase [Anaerolineae bacterium]